MKNENEIKRAFAMEVIKECRGEGNVLHLSDIENIIESLLPKEEEVDWCKASNAKILEEAKRRYPKGTVCRSASTNNEITSDGNPTWWREGKSIFITKESGLLYYEGKWAEIISKPEIVEPETKTESDEVKVGDEVDVLDVKEKCKVLAIHGGQVWVRSKESHINYLPMSYEVWRSQSLEQKARKKAEESIEKYYEFSKYELSLSLKKDVLEMLEYAYQFDPKTL
jgi:hypothetical protein